MLSGVTVANAVLSKYHYGFHDTSADESKIYAPFRVDLYLYTATELANMRWKGKKEAAQLDWLIVICECRCCFSGHYVVTVFIHCNTHWVLLMGAIKSITP